ncbi:pyruvate kinase [Gregarina niphandrodes]|uniref:Pyruvate kinase n=1 Tax=Gregarina niphandrodes TaxID=110365 RepID=A0A023B9A4_GRENI|nr:pyruvate kinase [Gregarina niphandrodes]EZG72377.1 pyruvate kinase [Gregarina niphandrodes]|eukprot:XP_011129775.1 pyruvate kinase [Gregarina niphandrodes]
MSQLSNQCQNISLSDVFATRTEADRAHRRTKIVCTLGPASWNVETLVEMMDAGMDICRFNFSHGDHETHGKALALVKEAQAQRPHKNIGLLLDTKGPEIRTGFFRDDLKSIELKKGQDLKIVTDYSFKGDSTCIACTYEKLPQTVKPGSQILIADGSLSVEVKEVQKDYVVTTVMNDAKIGERKNMNLPGAKVDLPVCGEREIKDFLEFGIPNKMHYIAASFVQCAQDIRDIRQILGEAGKHFKIIPKIENQEGLQNFDEILEECDGVMIARGDMGMEIPLEKVFLAQKMIIAKCNAVGKPVIVATQMLESMISAPRPTRAEVSDVANAVLDGCDAVMLSGESANGQFPVNAVRMLAHTALEAESCQDPAALFRAIHGATKGEKSVSESVACAAIEAAADVSADVLIVQTLSGNTARLMAKYRSNATVVAVSPCDFTVAQTTLLRGVIGVKGETIEDGIAAAKTRGLLKTGDKYVAVHGLTPCPGKSNLMKVLTA